MTKKNIKRSDTGPLRKRVAELTLVLKSVETINSDIDYHEVLDKLMDLAKSITGAEASSAILLDEDKLCFVAASGAESKSIKRIYLKKDEGIAGWVIKNNRALIVNNVAKDRRFSHKADNSSGFKTRSMIAVPLTIEGKIIGVVEVVNKKKSKLFTKKDMRMLSMLASSAAVAINKARLFHDLNELFVSTIKTVANAIEAKDTYLKGHCERITSFSLAIATEIGLNESDKKNVELAALLHDVGKIGVPEHILCKTDRLTTEEYEYIKKHPKIGADMLSSIKQLSVAIGGIKHHQEIYDGTGYPDGLKGEDIPLIARIIAVADTFDAMTTTRTYRKGLPVETALEEIKSKRGIQFDPECVDCFMKAYSKGLIIAKNPNTVPYP